MVPNADAEQWGPHQLLSMAARLIQRRQDQALADLGLTHAAVIALQGLASGPLNQEQLAEEIHVRSQSLGRVLARLEEAGFVARKSSTLDRRSNDVSITEAGLRALVAARKVEKETLPPDIVEGTVLSRELARVISYFPGSPRLGSRQRKERTTGPGIQGEGTDARGNEALRGSAAQQMESAGPESGQPSAPEAGIPESGKPGLLDESGSAAEQPSERAGSDPGQGAAEKARHLNGNRER